MYPPPFSQQHYNFYIKKICEIAGLNDKVKCGFTKGGEWQEITKYKWQMTSSHTARRTFASLAELNKIPRPAIMRMTGHTSEQSFLSYIRISNIQSAIDIAAQDFFKIVI